MFNMSEETKQKILEAIFVIEDDDNRKDRYKEVTVKSGVNNVFKKSKIFIRKLDNILISNFYLDLTQLVI